MMIKDLPATWCCAKIDQTFGVGQEIVFFVQLNKFKSGTGAVAMLLGHIIELIKTPFGVLFLSSWHNLSNAPVLFRNLLAVFIFR